MNDDEKIEDARRARGTIRCEEWPYPCPFRSCERLNRCLFVFPLRPAEKDAALEQAP